MTRREQILQALLAILEGIAGPSVKREAVVPQEVTPGGLLILREGEPGEPVETYLSPLAYVFAHQAEIEIYAQGGTAAARAASLDDLAAAVGTALAADRRLGGLCEWVEASAPSTRDVDIEGAAAVKRAVITLTLHYDTTDPLA